MEGNTALIKQELEYLAKRAELGRDVIMQMSLHPNQRKEPPIFSASRVAEMLERSPASVGRVIKDLGVGAGPDPTAKRYSIDQAGFSKIRDHYGSTASKPSGGARIIAVANQKGGVGKTTTVANLAPWLALRGLRTAVIDADSQASFTSYQSINPDVELDEDDTISPILTGDPEADGTPATLARRMRKAPHFQNLWFLPSCLELANGDVGAYKRQFEEAKAGRGEYVFYNRLQLAINEIRKDYDAILIDCPPHISAVSYNAVFAADMLLIPLGAHMLDLASTIRFIEWLQMIMDKLPGGQLTRLRFLVTNYDESPASADNLSVVRQVLGEHLLPKQALHSSEIQRASTLLKSIYEVPRPIGSRDAWSRACKAMDDVNREITNQLLEEPWRYVAGETRGGATS